MGQRFFAINVLAQLHRRENGEGMRVLSRGDEYRINVFTLIVKPAEIHILSCFGMFLRGLVKVFLIYVTKGDDVFAADLLGVRATAAARADDGNVEFIVW